MYYIFQTPELGPSCSFTSKQPDHCVQCNLFALNPTSRLYLTFNMENCLVVRYRQCSLDNITPLQTYNRNRKLAKR